MANNAITSNTATTSGSCGTAGNGTVGLTYAANTQFTLGGIIGYIQLASTSGLFLQPSVKNKSINSTAFYTMQGTAGFLATYGTAGTAILFFQGGTGNYRVQFPIVPNENVLLVNAWFGSAGANNTAIIDFSGEGNPA